MISKGGQHAPNWVRPRPAPKSKKQTQYLLKGSRCAELAVEIRPGLEGSACSELSTYSQISATVSSRDSGFLRSHETSIILLFKYLYQLFGRKNPIRVKVHLGKYPVRSHGIKTYAYADIL